MNALTLDSAHWLSLAVASAQRSLCLRSSCGAVVVQGTTVIGTGYNAPPRDDLAHRNCLQTQPSMKKPKSDRTCCVHAEWRAITNALSSNPTAVAGAKLAFARIEAGALRPSGNPYCTVCSRLALDVGIGSWLLMHQEGVREYGADEYHRISQRYDELAG